MKRIIYFVLLLFCVADIAYSFMQHYSQTLDGDMAGGIVPAADVVPILNSPLGLDALLNNETYPNPNRYFAIGHLSIILKMHLNYYNTLLTL